MVDKQEGFVPSEDDKAIVVKHLGFDSYFDPGHSKNLTLKKSEAERRKELVSEIEYDFQLAMNKGKYYLGKAVVNFYLKDKPKQGELFLDFMALAVSKLMINDKEIKASDVYKDQRLALELPNIQLGWNTVQVRYLNAYNTNRIGLHTYTDNADNQQYLYSQFEAFHCYNVFPVFDQPSLKAKMSLTAMCPHDWVAVSNSKERKYTDAKHKDARHVLERHDIEDFLKFYEEGASLYEFEQTPKISCYLYAICGGAYKIYEDFDAMHTPQRIYVRKSMDDYVRPQMVFGVTKTTIELYQKNFGARYPFSKVDHVMCPDYKYGAMENVGCITYADNLLFKSKELSTVDLTWIVVVIQHELCHMWFGNLVTMDWWDDLWLNEAFATSLSYKACSMGGPFVDDYIDESWLHMSAYKRWGLGEDLMPSNHNIQADCPSTDTAESLINGITYGKGSSMIKQLIFLIGWETFTNGLKIYFNRHSWSNTVLKDFIGAIQEAVQASNAEQKHDIFAWSKDWIQTKGSNRFTQHYEVKDGKIENYEIHQVPTKYAEDIMRFQSMNIGLYDKDGKLAEKVENVVINKEKVTKVKEMNGKPAAAAILMNSDDWGFGHFILDDESIKVFEQSLGNVVSNIDRAVIIGQMSAMMKQIEFPANKLPAFLKQLMNEQNQNLINALVQSCILAQASYLPPDTVTQFNSDAYNFFLEKAQKSDDKLKMFCIEKAIHFLHTKDSIEQLAIKIHEENDGKNPAFVLTKPQKQQVLKTYWACADFSKEQKVALKEIVLKDDNSDEAQICAKSCDMLLPDADLKEDLWKKITDPNTTEPQKDLMQKMGCFMQKRQQLNLIEPYFAKYYEMLPKVAETRNREFTEIFMAHLSPATMARDEDLKQFKAILEKANKEQEFFVLFLKKQIELIEVSQQARALCEKFKQ